MIKYLMRKAIAWTSSFFAPVAAPEPKHLIR